MIVGVLGAGNMGFAVARSLLDKAVIHAKDLILVEHNHSRQDFLKRETSAQVLDSVDDTISRCNVMFLAVKPQSARQACRELVPFLSEDTLVISIMAGVSVSQLVDMLGNHEKVCRCMPNMPVQRSLGVTAYFLSAKSLDRGDLVERLMSATGYCFRVDQEELIDAATAVSGSGPAYVYYIVEQLIKGAVKVGFSQSQAKTVVLKTLTGAIAELEHTDKTPQQLKEEVTSKAGTTEAALNVFVMNNIGTNLQNGIEAAFKRAVEISKERL